MAAPPFDRPPLPSEAPSLPSPADGGPIRGDAGIAGLVPFGIDRTKPRHFQEAAAIVWENRDNLKYAYDILSLGVCDGCSLGPRGLADDVIPGVHVCMSRLKLLRQNTIGAFSPAEVSNIDHLRRLTNEQLRLMGRVPYPFIRRPGDRGFSRVSWDEALGLIGERLREVPPERQAWFATSKGITNETYYAFTKSARLMGTNNVDFCARLCHQATVAGLTRTVGIGAPTVSLNDLISTDLILLWGTNLANNQPVSIKYLHYAKERGARIVVINPVLEKGLDAYWVPSIPKSAVFGTRLMDDFIQVKAGGDIALQNAVLKLLIEWKAIDRAFIDAHTAGWAAVEASLARQRLTDLSEQSGVPLSEIEWLAKLIARARTMISVYSMGLTQHRFGTENVIGISNLHLATGNLCKPHAGILPIRGHSGVQGGSECGVAPDKYPGGLPVNESNAAHFAALWGHPVPAWRGKTVTHMVDACAEGNIDFLYNIGGNLLATLPDPAHLVRAFGKVKLRIHQDINLNTSTLIDAAELTVLLPAQTRYEQRGGGTSTNTERRIRFSPEIPGHPHIGETKPEWEIPGLIAVAARPDLADALLYADAQNIRDEIGRVMPVYKGIENLRKAGDWVQWGGPYLYADGKFEKMPDQRAQFLVVEPPNVEILPGEFYLTNRRGKQFNSMVFADIDTLQGGKTRDDIFLAKRDAEALGIAEGERIRLINDLGYFDGIARIERIKTRHLQAYWPEVNHLIPRCIDPLSEQPDYNTRVRIEKIA